MAYIPGFSEDKNTLPNVILWLICTISAVIIFTVDLSVPLGVAGGVPYVVVILFALWSTNKIFSIVLAIVCSVLTIIAFYLSPEGGEYWKVIVNRSLAIFAIWTTAILILMWKDKEEQLCLAKSRLENEKIYFATLQGTQHIINNLLNQLQLVYLEAKKQDEFDRKILKLFSEMMKEASELLKNLSEVDDINEESIMQSVFPETNVNAIARIRAFGV